jgi:hypothetical protein
LYQTGAIAEIHEDEAAEISCAMDPSSQTNSCSGVLGAQRAAEMRAMCCGQRRFRHYVREKEGSALTQSCARRLRPTL